MCSYTRVQSVSQPPGLSREGQGRGGQGCAIKWAEVGRGIVAGGQGWTDIQKLANVCRSVQRFARCAGKGRHGWVSWAAVCSGGQECYGWTEEDSGKQRWA